jgi:hypothetical protein
VAGWKRILARNCDSDGGWGFNFVRQAVRANVSVVDNALRSDLLSSKKVLTFIFVALSCIQILVVPVFQKICEQFVGIVFVVYFSNCVNYMKLHLYQITSP